MNIKALAESVTQSIKSYVQAACDPLHERIRALEAAERREQRSMHYHGVWTAGDTYQPGAVVTDKGTIWYCHQATADRPGSTTCWQLMAKSK